MTGMARMIMNRHDRTAMDSDFIIFGMNEDFLIYRMKQMIDATQNRSKWGGHHLRAMKGFYAHTPPLGVANLFACGNNPGE